MAWPNSNYAGSELVIAAGELLESYGAAWGWKRTTLTKNTIGDATGGSTVLTGSPFVQQSEENTTEQGDTSIEGTTVLLFLEPFVDNNGNAVTPAIDDILTDLQGIKYLIKDVQNQRMNDNVALWEVRAESA